MAETVFPQAGAPAARPGDPIQLAGQGGVPRLTLVSHKLCPYVQRVAIVLAEKGLPYERIYIDLAHKPRWFLELSPLGKTPLLKVETGTGNAHVVFESAVIAEFLEDVFSHPMHPVDPLARAGHRGWVEVASSILNGIARLYGARDAEAFEREWQGLRAAFERVEAELSQAGRRPYFGGSGFSLVDAAFAPVFRYFDTFEARAGLFLFDGLRRVTAWRRALAKRESVRGAVTRDYPDLLAAFLIGRKTEISRRMA